MDGLNWVDAIIFSLLVAAVFGSLRTGVARLLCTVAGFFGALFLGGWFFPHILPIEDRTLKTLVNANLVLIGAAYGAFKGYDLGKYIRVSLPRVLRQTESALGVIPGIIATLLGVWLLAAVVGRLPFVGLSNSANDAIVVQALSRLLPPPPAVFAAFNQQVDPNASPAVLTTVPKPAANFNYSPSTYKDALAKSESSIVKITSFGCGGIGSGSGFVVAKDLVATNAHVVAGVKRPVIKYGNHSFEAIPILFRADIDLAILRVIPKAHAFEAPPLSLANSSASPDTTVAVLGYPDGDYSVTPGIIRSDRVVTGRNIYDMGKVPRNIYDVQTKTTYGSSGSPIVLADGKVAGIIFARYDQNTHYAIALTSLHLIHEVERAKTLQTRVGTGVCYAS